MDWSTIPTWLKSLGAAAIGGGAAALYDALVMQQGAAVTDYKKAAMAAIFGAVLAVAAYLKQSPVTPTPIVGSRFDNK